MYTYTNTYIYNHFIIKGMAGAVEYNAQVLHFHTLI